MIKQKRSELNKIFGIILGILGLIFILQFIFAFPQINFIAPTPNNATTTTNTSIILNMSINEDANPLSNIIYNWNGINYTLYDPSLVLMMNFDNLSALGENSSYVVDVSKYRNNGTVNGAIWNSSGKYGEAMSFNGTASIETVNNIGISGAQQRSILLWFKPDNTQGRGDLFSFGTASTYQIFNILYDYADEGLYFGGYAYDSAGSTNSITRNQWNFMALTFDGTYIKVYINGNSTPDINASLPLLNTVSSTLYIGRSKESAPSYFHGLIDSFQVWNRSLSSSEIQQLYMSNLYKYNSTQWYLYVNQTKLYYWGLDPGNYNYFIYANDSVGNMNQSETRQITILVPVGGSVVWTGANSTSWLNSANWNPARIPTISDYVILNASAANQPNLSIAVTIFNLTVNGTLTLSMLDALNVTENVLILSGGQIKSGDNSNSELYKVNITIGGNLTIDSGGMINVTGLGYDGGYGLGVGTVVDGGSYGGRGGDYNGDGVGITYGSVTNPINIGSGGGRGGDCSSGGGAVILNINGASIINGLIIADSPSNGAGGSGGSIYLITSNLSGNGSINVNGGVGTNGGWGNGGGGRIAVFLTNGTDFGNINFSAYSGSGAANNGAAGTIYLKKANQTYGELRIDNANFVSTFATTLISQNTTYDGTSHIFNFETINISRAGQLEITNGTLNLTSTTLTGDGNINSKLILNATDTNLIFGNSFNYSNITISQKGTMGMTWNTSLTIGSGGILTHEDNSVAETNKINLTILGNLTILSGGMINATGKGYGIGYGPGTCSYSACSAGYGGQGREWDGGPSFFGKTYGSITSPTSLGSGGPSTYGTAGGGAVILNITGSSVINGSIISESNTGPSTGSGGSIYIISLSISGNGTIKSNGGVANPYAAGGGGRVAIVLTNGTDFGNLIITSFGGIGASRSAAAGTIYLKRANQTYGDLIVDNNGTVLSTSTATMISPNVTYDGILRVYNFDLINISKIGKLEFSNGTLNLTSTTLTGDGNINSKLILNVTDVNLIFGNSFNYSNVTISQRGTTRIVFNTSLTIGDGGILTHEDNSVAETNKINLTILGNLTILSGGSINVTGLGYDLGYGPGTCSDSACGGGYGGSGGVYTAGYGLTYGSITSPTSLGSGGSVTYGGSGGGAIILNVSENIINNGSIVSNPNSAQSSGSGGSIFIITRNLSGFGIISSNSINPTTYAGGGGGRTAIILANGTDFGNLTITSYGSVGLGGSASSKSGAAGTVFLKRANQAYGDLIIDNNNTATGSTTLISPNVTYDDSSRIYNFDVINISRIGQLEIQNGTLNLTSTTLIRDGNINSKLILNGSNSNYIFGNSFNYSNVTISQRGTTRIVFNTSLTIGDGGILTHEDNSVAETNKINLTILGNLTILSGALINVTGLGYDQGYGPGAGTIGLYAAGSYGGSGGNGPSWGGISGTTYGSITSPGNIGSGSYSGAGSSGGGAVIFNITGNANINGTILANAGKSGGYSAGSGGSVFIIAQNFSGFGLINVNGERELYGSMGSGGGGRISVILTNGTDFGNVNLTAFGGQTGLAGAAGTIFLKRANQSYGDLVIDNNGTSASASTLISENVSGTSVSDIIIRNAGSLNISAYNFSIGIYPSLTIYGNFNKTSTGNFSMGANSTLVIAGDSNQNTTLYSNESFYNLNITKKGGYVFFPARWQMNVSGTFNVLGNS